MEYRFLKEWRSSLSKYKELSYDGWCGEPIRWGYEITKYLGDTMFEKLRQDVAKEGFSVGCLEPGSWGVIIERLTIKDAIKKYGEITKITVGPRGGFKEVDFGKRTFCWRGLDPRNTKYFNKKLIAIEK